MNHKSQWLTLATHVPASGAGGGMVRVVMEFVHAAARQDRFDINVLCRPEATALFSDIIGDRRRVHVVPGPANVAAMSSYEQFLLPVTGRRFDVIHGTKHILPLRLPVSGRPRLVLTVHDMVFLDRPGDFPGIKGAILREPYLASLRMADSLSCVSEATRQRMMTYVPSTESRSKVVPLATPAELTSVPPVAVPQLEGRTFALVVGDDSARKNLGTLVAAMRLARAEMPDAVLAVVGGKNWGETASAAVLEAAASDGTIVPLGFRTDQELRWCYENAAVVCCPSVLEGFGLPALEARTFSRPLITSDDPALVEVSGPGAVHVGSQDPREWQIPLLAGLQGRLAPSTAPAPRSWDDFVRDTSAGVLR